MQGRLTTSIVLYGDIDSSNSLLWRDFYDCATGLFESIELKPNYLGATGQSFKTGKISLLSKTQKKLYKSLENGEELVSLALYSLPENFKTAAFDYYVYIGRTKQSKHPHLLVTFCNNLLDSVNLDELVLQLRKFIKFECGQIFELSILESPQIYASKANSPDAFKSIKIIKDMFV